MSEEHKVYVPIRGKHVEPPPVYVYSARWYEEQGLKLPKDKPWRPLACWLRRTLRRAGIEFDRKERYLRLGRLSISWDCE